MHRRVLICALCVLSTLVALPLSTSAATTQTAKISSTSYVDYMGDESFPLCGQYTFADTDVSYSGTGTGLGGNGTGAMQLNISGIMMTFTGEASVHGKSLRIEGQAILICTTPNSAILAGTAMVVVGRDAYCGILLGSLSDKDPANQGSLSWKMSGVRECDVPIG